MTRVSVILCCYNDADRVATALESLEKQTLARDRYDVIFVDDGSTDDTEHVARAFQRRLHLRYVRHPLNRGLPASCNRGLREASGDYCIRLDADDVFDPTILEVMCPPLEAGLADFVYCDRVDYDVQRHESRAVCLEPFNLFHLIAVGTMMRRDLLQAIGGYRNLFWEEYDLYLRYLLKSSRPPHHIPQPLVTHMIRGDSMTADRRRVREGWEEFRRRWPRETLERFGALPSGMDGLPMGVR